MMNKKLVEAVVERMSSQTAVSAGEVEAVLDTLSQMGLLAPSQNSLSPSPDDPAFAMTFHDYLSLSAADRRAMALDLQERRRDWLERQLGLHRAAWIIVIGGQVVESSPRLDDYPTPERLMKLGKEYDLVPFIFSRPPLFEEISWSALPENDFYPTLALTIGAGNLEHDQLPTQGRNLIADFSPWS